MRLFRFDRETATPVDRHGSTFGMARIARLTNADVRLSCMYLGPGGLVGHHQAAVPQLFLVMAGGGWVEGSGSERVTISAGQAAFWDGGEGHAVGTVGGLTAIVVEAEGLNPAEYLTPI